MVQEEEPRKRQGVSRVCVSCIRPQFSVIANTDEWMSVEDVLNALNSGNANTTLSDNHNKN